MVEVTGTLRRTFGLSAQKVMYRESEFRRHFPEAWIEDYEKLIPTMTNHPKDRHVLAAAAHAGATKTLAAGGDPVRAEAFERVGGESRPFSRAEQAMSSCPHCGPRRGASVSL